MSGPGENERCGVIPIDVRPDSAMMVRTPRPMRSLHPYAGW